MKRALVLSLVLTTTVGPGCLAHERETDVDAGAGDAGSDTSTLASRDAGCLVQCPAAELLGHIDTSLTATAFGITATSEGIFALALVYTWDPATDYEVVPTVYRLDATRHTLRALPLPSALRSDQPLQGADLRLVGDQLRVVMLQTSPVAMRRHDASVGSAVWSTAGTLVAERDAMATAPFMLTSGPDTDVLAGVFGEGERDVAAFADGAVLHAFLLDGTDTPPALIDLVRLADTGSLLPVSGAFLDDGRIAVAGGGTTRAAFLAVGALADAPLTAQPVIGQPYDPAPVVVREPGGFALARHVSDATDLARSALHVRHHALDGALLRESIIATEDGRSPQTMTAFASNDGVGVAWTEMSDGEPTASYLRVLLPGADAECSALAAVPVARLDPIVTSIVATMDGEDVVVGVVTQSLVPPEQVSLSLYRVAHCSIAR